MAHQTHTCCVSRNIIIAPADEIKVPDWQASTASGTGTDMHAFALRPEQAENLHRPLPGAAAPVRQHRVSNSAASPTVHDVDA